MTNWNATNEPLTGPAVYEDSKGTLVCKTWNMKTANLIAAAPDLLDALELILPLAKGYRAQPKSDQARATNSSWISAAEEAINKANGVT